MKIINNIKEKILNTKIPVKYKQSIYKVKIPEAIYIYRQLSWLFSRRALRSIKRIVIRFKDITIVVICAFLFSSVIIPTGIALKKYTFWYEALWDMRTFFLTSILIVFVNTNISEERRRKEGLQKQFNYYLSYMFDAEQYLTKLVSLVGISSYDHKIFLTEELLNNFEKVISENPDVPEFTIPREEFIKYKNLHVYLIALNKRHVSTLRDLLHSIDSSDSIQINNKESVRPWIKTGIDTIEDEILLINSLGENYKPKDISNFVLNSLTYNIYIIAELRRPWRWDYERNVQIRNKLLNSEHVKGFNSVEYWID
ncbi:hypothetical protein SAMN05443252_1144 [Bacillus sp. OV322]|uniref:hypothetical protein n=1 Tax=Bacillus sp. OV322 TaxID=1882764 RepID=UPI0008F0995E|nr:hypothetical protein [Bacillus sp. OV322]SFD02125.1 hypothetical protein SAMN05443252_1144 [Bacillus sp. OV322]